MTRILVPSGALGLGYDAAALKRGIEARPDLIAIDGGSTDSGPYYLGKGVSKYARASTKAEWSGLIEARAQGRCSTCPRHRRHLWYGWHGGLDGRDHP